MDEIQEMRSRVDSLERSLKRWQVVTLAAVLFCLIVGGVSNSMHRAMPAAGNATAEDGEFGVIRARRIEIAHPEGGSKIELFAIPSGAAIRIEGTKASTFLERV